MAINTELALEALREYLDLIERSRRPADLAEQSQIHDAMTALRPTIERIAAAVDPGIGPARFGYMPSPGGGSTLVYARQGVVRLIGILERQHEIAAIFTPKGPQLAATGLHPWVWNAARDLWRDAHHRNAVGDAATKVETMLQAKLGRHDVSGKDLYAQAFTTADPKADAPRLRVRGLAAGTPRWTSAHEGAMHFGMGCAQGLRNWAAHALDDADEQLALEYLAALSVLARWIEEADVVER